MRRFPFRAAALVALFVLPAMRSVAGESPAPIWIHAGRLVDVVAERVRPEVTIAIEGERIVSVEDGYRTPPRGTELIDLRSATVLPGLMDMHTHISSQMSKQSYSEGFRLDPQDFALRSVEYARRTLHAGFTTIRDLGDRHRLSISLRNAIDQGWIEGPRIFTAGKSLATTGGHADPTNGMNFDLMGDPGPREGVVNGIADARDAVRQRYKDGADLIKITATGGVLSMAKNGQNPQFLEEEIAAVVEVARDYGFHVAAHAHGAEGMKRAIRAGVRSIEHGTLMDDEVIELMKEHDTFYVPTLLAGDFVARKAELDDYFPAVVRPKAAAIGPKIKSTVARAHEAGVEIVFGTDCGVAPHGTNAREFALMVEAGMTPLGAIVAATRTAAELLEVTDDLGAVAPGRYADLVAVEADPLADIRRLENVDFVMKGGRVVKPR